MSRSTLAFLLIFFTSCTITEAVCSSTCGSIRNISYPFRLQGDPSNCGNPTYELSCKNSQTILNLNPREYVVKAISYENQTIRVLDPGLQSNNCSSLPKYFLTTFDFQQNNSYTLVPEFDPFNDTYVTYITCLYSVDDPSYIATNPCINSSSGAYYYVLVGSATVNDLKVSCTTTAMVPSDISMLGNSTVYLDVWSSLLMGFELSWRPSLCAQCDAAGGSCLYPFFNDYDLSDSCYNPCREAFQSMKCFWQYLGTFLQGFGVQFLIKTGYVLAGRTTIGMLCLFAFVTNEVRKRRLTKNNRIEQFLEKYRNLTPTRYSYGEIRRMTSGFKEKLGQGGFGSVFKGRLASGLPVAVKILGKLSGNGEEFINEVATIGRIHHVNVVQLIGFSFEGSKRALIYDYMPNGSLDKYIYLKEGQNNTLGLEKMYEIALETARGIEYLHRGCDMQILHFDIKPHNILLDANFTPKISDFGLAKLYPTNHSIVSISAAKGTIGYIAPELLYRTFGRISYKSDVYSFGRMLLEMIGRRKYLEETASKSSQVLFHEWAYDQITRGEDVEIHVDMEPESNFARMLLIVGLWCTQMIPVDRPSMHKVLEMLEGSVENLLMPPRPSLMFPSEGDMEISQMIDSSENLSPLETNNYDQYSASIIC